MQKARCTRLDPIPRMYQRIVIERTQHHSSGRGAPSIVSVPTGFPPHAIRGNPPRHGSSHIKCRTKHDEVQVAVLQVGINHSSVVTCFFHVNFSFYRDSSPTSQDLSQPVAGAPFFDPHMSSTYRTPLCRLYV